MKIISYREAMLLRRYTEHGLMLLDVVRRQPGIRFETLVRDHDPGPPPLLVKTHGNGWDDLPGKAFRRGPRGGFAVSQLCKAGDLVITERLRVYLPDDLPLEEPSEKPEENSLDDSRESDPAPPKETAEGCCTSA